MTERLGPLMSTFLALQTDNEATFAADKLPFAQDTGTFTAPDGTSYDMSVPEQRQAAADDTIVAYADAATAAVKNVDPDLMVTMGAFTNRAVGKPGYDGFATNCAENCSGDFRYPARVSTLTRESALDFFDIHTYPNPQFTLEEALNSVEWPDVEGVVINGEFGAKRDHFGNDINRAAEAMRTHQVDSCKFNLTGWLFWTWDTDEDDIQRLFFRGNEAGGVIDNELAPVNRPDPCQHEAPQVEPLAVDSPVDGQVSDDGGVEFTGSGHAGGEVTLTVDDEVIASTTVADDARWSVTPESDLPVGTRFDATLTQVVGLDYQDVVVSDLGVRAPAETIDEPADGATIDSGDQSFAGSSYPGTELGITLEAQDSGATIDGDLDRDEDGSWTFTPSDDLVDGDYTLTAEATAGEEGDPELVDSEAAVSFTVETTGGDDGTGESGSDDDLPDTGSAATSLIVIAMLLVAAGGVMATRTRSLSRSH